MLNLGDYVEDATVYVPFNTVDIDSASVTMSGDGTLKVYKNGFVTSITAGITFSEDVATGMHGVTIDMSADAAYTTAAQYMLAVEGATVDGTAINSWLAVWTCEKATPTAATLTTIEGKVDTVDTVADAILVDTGTTLPAQISALNNISVADILTTQMTEAYAADGTAPTLAQALFWLISVNTEFSKSGTTITYKKLDGSTTAGTATLDDAQNPTSHTRAS